LKAIHRGTSAGAAGRLLGACLVLVLGVCTGVCTGVRTAEAGLPAHSVSATGASAQTVERRSADRQSADRQGAATAEIRVLLFDAVDEVIVSHPGSGKMFARLRAIHPEGLRVNGGPVVSSWRHPGGNDPVEVRAASGQRLTVRGAVEVMALFGAEAERGPGLAVVNQIPLERYLAGSLAREMYGSWGGGALQAQAVVSRTYVLHQRNERRGAPWHVTAGTSSQVYQGVSAESEPVEAALVATRGEILTHDGAPILAVFHSSAGGRTAGAEEVWGQARPYLVSLAVEDEWESPDAYWRARVSRTTLGRAMGGLGADIGPIVRARVSQRTSSGRVARVELVGERGATVVSGRSLRDALGESILKSTLFELRKDEQGFVFVGSGSGHGVGMSQWGARAMARRGDDYRQILKTFYPGTEITRLEGPQ
jgi:stage II sporulation protein D